MAFDAAHQYSSYYLLLIGSLIFLWLFFKSLFYLLIYSSNIIRFKLFYKYGLLLFPLYLSSDVLEELWLLNIDDTPHKQLLQLDELIQQTKHKLNNQLFIIKNHFEQLFVILIKRKLDENLDIQNDLSLFIVCPVTDIKKIVQSRGICYGEDSSWIPWRSTITGEQNYSEWLHEELMEISEHYQNQYAYRLRNERQNESEDMWNFLNLHSYSDTVYRRHELPEIERSDERELEELIREEQNFQHFRLERQYFYEQTSAASPEFIAKFRLEHKLNKNLINSNMEKDNLKCTICYDDLKLNDSYAKWPCPSIIPHIFHYNCMLKILRRSNICPLCRYPIESRYIIPQFFQNFLF